MCVRGGGGSGSGGGGRGGGRGGGARGEVEGGGGLQTYSTTLSDSDPYELKKLKQQQQRSIVALCNYTLPIKSSN